MTKEQNEVRELMLKMGQECPPKPTIPSMEIRKLRIKLITEELLELCAAFNIDLEISDDEVFLTELEYFGTANLVEAHDATIDLRVVVIGTDIAMGIDGEPGWQEVHRSNMSKTGGGMNADGKFLKGPNYTPPNLAPIIEAQSNPPKHPTLYAQMVGRSKRFTDSK